MKRTTAATLATFASIAFLSGPAQAQRLVALGDSITEGKVPAGVRKPFPDIIAAALGIPLLNLGYDGTTSFRLPAENVPHIPNDASVVTLFIGSNDVGRELVRPAEVRNFDAVTTLFANSMHQIISGVRERAPQAKILVATIPNPADTYVAVGVTEEDRRRITKMINTMNDAIKQLDRITVVDLNCNPQMYRTANFASIYDIHPNSDGHEAIAQAFLKVVNEPTPLEHCIYQEPFQNFSDVPH